MPSSPTVVRAKTKVASPSQIGASMETSSTFIVLILLLALELVGLALEVLEATAHEERLLRVAVELAVAEPLERVDGLLDRHERARDAGELLGDEGVLRQEALDAPRPADDDLVLFGELVDAEDRDDVLEL